MLSELNVSTQIDGHVVNSINFFGQQIGSLCLAVEGKVVAHCSILQSRMLKLITRCITYMYLDVITAFGIVFQHWLHSNASKENFTVVLWLSFVMMVTKWFYFRVVKWPYLTGYQFLLLFVNYLKKNFLMDPC